jgi:hypothetical protein
MSQKAGYARPEVVGPCASGRYVHRAALFFLRKTNAQILKLEGSMSFFLHYVRLYFYALIGRFCMLWHYGLTSV